MTSAASVVTLKLLEDGSGVAHGLTVPQSQLLLANEIIQSHVGRTTALEHATLRLVLAYSVEKLHFRGRQQNCWPYGASLKFGRRGGHDFLVAPPNVV